MVLFSCGEITKPYSKHDYIRIIELMLSNNDFFYDNPSDKHPRVFYIGQIIKAERTLSFRQELISLLKQNKIRKIYIFNQTEVWFVYDESSDLFFEKEYMIGYRKKAHMPDDQRDGFKLRDLKQLDESWYSATLQYSFAD